MNISPVSISLFKSQVLSSLTSSASDAKSKGNDSWANIFSLMASNDTQPAQLTSDPLSLTSQRSYIDPLSLITQSSYINQSSGIKGLASAGRNMALPDPESAYRMMSVINNADVTYKAQFSELSHLKSYVAQMADAGQSLGNIMPSTANDSIGSQLQGFVTQYNSWVERFEPDMQEGGVLAGTQAAQVSRFELSQSITNIFNGAKNGVHGLKDLGIAIDPNTSMATLDAAKLDSILAGNKQGAVNALQEFSANFAKSANLLNSGGNFIPKQLDNLGRAIHFIADNAESLRTEFGTGSAAKPSDQVAQALAAYNRTYGI